MQFANKTSIRPLNQQSCCNPLRAAQIKGRRFYFGSGEQAVQSKVAHFIALSHPYTSMVVAQVFIEEVARLQGFPSPIISDKDDEFMTLFWKELFKKAGTKLKYSSTYHPQTNRQSEVTNRTLDVYLRCSMNGHPKI